MVAASHATCASRAGQRPDAGRSRGTIPERRAGSTGSRETEASLQHRSPDSWRRQPGSGRGCLGHGRGRLKPGPRTREARVASARGTGRERARHEPRAFKARIASVQGTGRERARHGSRARKARAAGARRVPRCRDDFPACRSHVAAAAKAGTALRRRFPRCRSCGVDGPGVRWFSVEVPGGRWSGVDLAGAPTTKRSRCRRCAASLRSSSGLMGREPALPDAVLHDHFEPSPIDLPSFP